MPKDISWRNILNWQSLAGLLVLIIIPGLGLLYSQAIRLPSALKVAPEHIQVYATKLANQASRPTVGQAIYDLAGQFKIEHGQAREYVVSFKAETGDQRDDKTVYVPVSGGALKVFLNGIPLGNSNTLPLALPGQGRFFYQGRIPPGYLHPGENRLSMILSRDETRTGIPAFYLGPASRIAPAHRAQMDWLKGLKRAWQFGILVGFIVILSGLWFKPLRTFFLSASLALAALAWLTNWQDVPASIGKGWLAAMHLLALLFVFVALFVACQLLARKPSGKGVFARTLCVLALSGSGLTLLSALFAPHLPLPASLSMMAALAVLPFFILLLPMVLWQNIWVQQSLTRDLQAQLTREQAAREREQARALRLMERQRLIRDMHDGIGGQLLSLLLRIRAGRIDLPQIEQDVQASVNDLRLIVDSMDHVGDNLETALATFRERAQAQADAADITLTWTQNGLAGLKANSSRAILQVYRIMQEILSNALRHSGADDIRIDIKGAGGWLRIRIRDNGYGFAPDNIRAGHGLKNMQKRADSLGARLEIISPCQPKGSCFTLSVPVDRLQT